MKKLQKPNAALVHRINTPQKALCQPVPPASEYSPLTFCPTVALTLVPRRRKQDRQCTYKSHVKERWRNHCWRKKKAVSMTYSKYMSLTLSIQHAIRMRHIVTCGLSGSTVYFSTLSHKRQDYRGKEVIKHKICAVIFYTTSVWNIYRSKNSTRYRKCISVSM